MAGWPPRLIYSVTVTSGGSTSLSLSLALRPSTGKTSLSSGEAIRTVRVPRLPEVYRAERRFVVVSEDFYGEEDSIGGVAILSSLG